MPTFYPEPPVTWGITREEVYRQIWAKSVKTFAEELRQPPSLIRSFCKATVVPTPPRGYFQRKVKDESLRPALPPPPPERDPALCKLMVPYRAPPGSDREARPTPHLKLVVSNPDPAAQADREKQRSKRSAPHPSHDPCPSPLSRDSPAGRDVVVRHNGAAASEAELPRISGNISKCPRRRFNMRIRSLTHPILFLTATSQVTSVPPEIRR